MQIEPLYTLSGAAVGLIIGLTGVGGGSLMTPLLVLAFGAPPATAVGTDLLYAALTKSAGSVVHNLRGNVDWRVVRLLACGSVPASALALFALSRIGVNSEQTSRAISLTLGIAQLLTAISILMRARLLKLRAARNAAPDGSIAVATVAVGAILGLLVSLSSVGAGAIGMTALLMLYPASPVVRLVGTDIAHAVPLTLIAGGGHWILGSVDSQILASLLIGSAPGIVIGSYVAPRMPDRFLRSLLAAVLFIVGLRLIAG